MSKRQFLTLIGVWVIIFLFLGFPVMWHKIIAIVSGLAIVAIAYSLPPTEKKKIVEVQDKPFVESSTPE